MPNAIRGNGSKNARAVHLSGMDAVFARREAEAGTESHDLLLQQEEAEEREQDVRDAQGAQGRRQQAHGTALPAEGVTRFPPPPRGTARRSPFSLFLLTFGHRAGLFACWHNA